MQPDTSKLKPYLRKISPRVHWRELLAVVMVLLAIVFFRSERRELYSVIPQIQHTNIFWLLSGIFITIVSIIFFAGIYRESFSAIGLRLKWQHGVILFLKRNFIAVFLPAGGVSALTYSPRLIRKQGFTASQIHQASGLYGFVGLLTVFIAGLPVLVYVAISSGRFKYAWIGLLAVSLLIILIFIAVRSIKRKQTLYRWMDKKFPSLTPSMNELFGANVDRGKFVAAIMYSTGVELCGMIQVFIAMLALGLSPSAGAAASAYIISVLLAVISPFLRGLGAVELTMVYVLEQYGYGTTSALSITLLYRLFEFWIPLFSGLIAYSWKGRKLFLRAAPSILTLLLGLINIISGITPPVHHRLSLLRRYLPLTAIHATNMLVLFLGIALLVASAFLFRGLRNAWLIALILAGFSLIGHLTKALDYEEATFAAVTLVVLILTANQYRIRSSSKWLRAGIKTALYSFAAVILFGIISFYYIDRKHFGIDFTWQESVIHAFKAFLLVEDSSLQPVTRFGTEFTWLIRSLGFLTWTFFLFALIKTHKRKYIPHENSREKAAFLLNQFGNSTVDYFKLYKDKLLFFSDVSDAFIAYRIANGFAIVLEEPVCAQEHKVQVLQEFDNHCRKMGLKPAFYRVDENSMPWFNQLKKQRLMIGQEAIIDINHFKLEGRDKKSLRNGINSLQKQGYSVATQSPPYDNNFLNELKGISDEWLQSIGKAEFIFSQGMFDQNELKQQDIITVRNADNMITAFLNIIPDYAEDECTYDLIRKSNDAPAAAMDALIIKLIDYARDHKKQFLNLGMVPMTGIAEPENTAEQIIKFAAEKIRGFQHYKGLRNFKEKYASFWVNKYLVYDNDIDLLQLPLALRKVMKP